MKPWGAKAPTPIKLHITINEVVTGYRVKVGLTSALWHPESHCRRYSHTRFRHDLEVSESRTHVRDTTITKQPARASNAAATQGVQRRESLAVIEWRLWELKSDILLAGSWSG
jgi:hypothetical protein